MKASRLRFHNRLYSRRPLIQGDPIYTHLVTNIQDFPRSPFDTSILSSRVQLSLSVPNTRLNHIRLARNLVLYRFFINGVTRTLFMGHHLSIASSRVEQLKGSDMEYQFRIEVLRSRGDDVIYEFISTYKLVDDRVVEHRVILTYPKYQLSVIV